MTPALRYARNFKERSSNASEGILLAPTVPLSDVDLGLIPEFQGYGLFLVPVGELEQWPIETG